MNTQPTEFTHESKGEKGFMVQGNKLLTYWARKKGGKVQHAFKEFEGNSRHTPEEQAYTALLQKIRKALRDGYKLVEDTFIPEEIDVEKESAFSKNPCRYKNLKGNKALEKLPFPVFWMLKLNGINARVEKGKLVSRGGKEIPWTFPDIEKYEGYAGELGRMGCNEHDVKHLLAHPDPEKPLTLYLFDFQDPHHTFKERWETYLSPLKDIAPEEVEIVDAAQVHSQKELEQVVNWFKEVSEGNDFLEGLIFHRPDSMYQFGKRLTTSYKWKPLQDREYRITGTVVDMTKDGVPVVSFICETEDGTPFKVIPGWTVEERNKFLTEGKDVIGRWGKVEFYSLSAKQGVPYHATLVTVRDEPLEGIANED